MKGNTNSFSNPHFGRAWLGIMTLVLLMLSGCKGKDPQASVESVTLSVTSYAFTEAGQTVQLKVAITPANATNNITWLSSDEAVATVSSDGLVTCKGIGNATITATIDGKSASCAISANYNFTENAWNINMKMIWVEGGEFVMGCTSEQGDCDSDEQNVRRVTLDSFYIGMLEVTQSQWEKVMLTSIYQQRDKLNPHLNVYGVGPDYPMYYVNWDEATEFCRKLSDKTGKTYALPTEAQWEYAARGGKKADGTKYAGSNVADEVAWYSENSGSTSHVCGSKRANALGIYDMSGNVWEWCKDWYASSYVSYDTNNPTGPSSGSYRVLRGGSWGSLASNCRVANRNDRTPSNRNYDLGFRVVLIP